MIEELNKILWWIPSKKIRDSIRNIYTNQNSIIKNLEDRINILENKNNILTECNNGLMEEVYMNIHRLTMYNIYKSNKIDYNIKRRFMENLASKFLGYSVNIENPKSFNEKVNWLKLNYRNPLMKVCANKYTFKEYIKSQLGDGYTIPLLGVWDNANNIDFDKLPNQFVLKSNAGSVSREIIIVKNKNEINIDQLKITMNNWLQPWNASGHGSNWFFLDIPQKIIAEEYVEEIEMSETDFSIFCSYGKILYLYVYIDKTYYLNKGCIYYDTNWNKLPIKREGYKDIESFEKPTNLKTMMEISEKLSEDFPLVRVDFYNTKNKLLLGELTFTPAGGWGKFDPVEWDYKFGEMIDLNKIPKEHLRSNT